SPTRLGAIGGLTLVRRRAAAVGSTLGRLTLAQRSWPCDDFSSSSPSRCCWFRHSSTKRVRGPAAVAFVAAGSPAADSVVVSPEAGSVAGLREAAIGVGLS